jgi:hypothetical protein
MKYFDSGTIWLFGQLKAIAVDQGGQTLLKSVNAEQEAGVVDAGITANFV